MLILVRHGRTAANAQGLLQGRLDQPLDDEGRRVFVDGGTNIVLADLGMDSLGEMEFCIAIELRTGVTLLPSDLAELGTTDAVERRIREKLDETRSGNGTGQRP